MMSRLAVSVSILVLFSVGLVLLNNNIVVKQCFCQENKTCYVPDLTDCEKYKICNADGDIIGEDSCHFGTYRKFFRPIKKTD